MSGCYFCGRQFAGKDGDTPIHIKAYDIDICPRCVQVSQERWDKMMASVTKKDEKYIPEPVME